MIKNMKCESCENLAVWSIEDTDTEYTHLAYVCDECAEDYCSCCYNFNSL